MFPFWVKFATLPTWKTTWLNSQKIFQIHLLSQSSKKSANSSRCTPLELYPARKGINFAILPLSSTLKENFMLSMINCIYSTSTSLEKSPTMNHRPLYQASRSAFLILSIVKWELEFVMTWDSLNSQHWWFRKEPDFSSTLGLSTKQQDLFIGNCFSGAELLMVNVLLLEWVWPSIKRILLLIKLGDTPLWLIHLGESWLVLMKTLTLPITTSIQIIQARFESRFQPPSKREMTSISLSLFDRNRSLFK